MHIPIYTLSMERMSGLYCTCVEQCSTCGAVGKEGRKEGGREGIQGMNGGARVIARAINI